MRCAGPRATPDNVSKLGVGVGDDFSIHNGLGHAQGGDPTARDDRAEYEEWSCHRAMHRCRYRRWIKRNPCLCDYLTGPQPM
jgi:hypothetical protein